VGLDPEELFKAAGISSAGDPRENIGHLAGQVGVSSAVTCHGCGCCELVCPSRLPLSTVISEGTGSSGGMSSLGSLREAK
jgi:electron transport complex protein RnfC